MMFSFRNARTAHIRLGRKGERIASRFLRSQHIEIFLNNYRNKRGEIDIIARDGNTVCFIEVKTRKLSSKTRPGEGLRLKQKQRIAQSASRYLKEIGRPKVVYRFDLIEIVMGRWDIAELRYWKNHFNPRDLK